MKYRLSIFATLLAAILIFTGAGFAQNVPNPNFMPTGTTTLAVSGSSASIALPTTNKSSPLATTVFIQNTGATDARVVLGNSSVVATTTSYLVPAGQWRAWYIGSQTFIAAITASSTTTLDITTGTGVPSGGNLGSGSSGGGSVTQGTVPWIVAGGGTAGTPGTAVLTVQGVGSGTPVPVSAASLPLPTGAATAAKQPALGTAGVASADVLTVQGVASMTPILETPNDGTHSVVLDACQTATKLSAPISQAANAKIISAVSGKKNYICSITFNVGDAENISIVEGTVTVCGTGTAAMLGGTTAVNGMNLLAGGGLSLGNGAGLVMASAGTNVDTCIFQSGGGRVAGVFTYVQQ